MLRSVSTGCLERVFPEVAKASFQCLNHCATSGNMTFSGGLGGAFRQGRPRRLSHQWLGGACACCRPGCDQRPGCRFFSRARAVAMPPYAGGIDLHLTLPGVRQLSFAPDAPACYLFPNARVTPAGAAHVHLHCPRCGGRSRQAAPARPSHSTEQLPGHRRAAPPTALFRN